jgi:ABC-type multidrug transport system fused ATPase/permease subunit
MNYLKIIHFLLGEDARKLPLYLALFLVSGVFEIAGLSLIAPYVALVFSSESDALIPFSQYLTWISNWFGEIDLIFFLGVGLILVFFLKGLISIYINYLIIRFSAFQQARLKIVLMSAYQDLNYSKYAERNSSEYIQTIQSLTATFTNSTVLPGLKLISDAIVALSIVATLAVLQWQAITALLVLAVLGFLFYDNVFKARLVKYGSALTLAAERVTQGIQEGLQGLKEIRILGKEKFFLKMVTEGSIESAKIGVRKGLISSAFRYIFEFFIVVFLVGLITYVTFQEKVEIIHPSILIAFGIAAVRLTPLLNSMNQALIEIRASQYPVKRLYADLAEIPNISSPRPLNDVPTIKEGVFQELRLNDVSFSYESTGIRVLKNIDLTLQAGEAIGIMGESGTGKSTFLNVLLGLLDPEEGEISINRRTLTGSVKNWHSMVAYIPQDAFYLDASIATNISLMDSLSSGEEEKISKSIDQAQLNSLVSELSGGIESRIGEKGIKISGGQKQRVALARALYHNRDVLVLDEATSALDEETEREIVEEIRFLKGPKTVIVVAHRESTLKFCDRVYELINGTLVERMI